MYNEVITLIGTEATSDEIGNQKDKVISQREIFAKKKSVTMSETYKAWSAEMNPSAVFVIADLLDYEDEKYIIHEGKQYRVIRTYNPENTNQLEIVVERDEKKLIESEAQNGDESKG